MPETSVPVAPLYTRYVKKTDEYRVHVLDNEVVDVQKKMRKRGVWNGEWMIRTHAHGWVFGRENIAPPQCVVDAARTAVNDLGLTYGAVDIGYNRHYASAVIFEVNTAPGMVNTTLNRVSTAFKRLLRRYDNAA
jgi:glutathione synthase/RimK-type ligase-like ATP-grasp enzyme